MEDPKEKLETRIEFRASKVEKKKVERRAKELDLTTSQYLRKLLNKDLKSAKA